MACAASVRSASPAKTLPECDDSLVVVSGVELQTAE